MSTFKGYLKEFPNLAIDYFRPREPGSPPVHAYLLSHTHSDHLQGLDNHKFGGAFVYCSQVTKDILLKVQERSNRPEPVHERVCKYGHLQISRGRSQDLLRVLPVNVPCTVSVGAEVVTITLFDANHCPGSVMFLIEGARHAVLYTGDMRAEASFLASFLANPLLAAYTSGLRTLDCIYLDTSAKVDGPGYPEQVEGCRALVQGISQYPKTTTFYLNAWCTGYEGLWLAVFQTFKMQIHVDAYHYRLFDGDEKVDYRSTKSVITSMKGVLTKDCAATRFHSCEGPLPCPGRSAGEEVVIKAVNVVHKIAAVETGRSYTSLVGETDRDGDLSLEKFVLDQETSLLGEQSADREQSTLDLGGRVLPRTLVIPYARHSSYPELIRFVKALKPREVHACTGNEGWRFNEHCLQGSSSDHKIKVYEDLTRRGLWDESPMSRRNRLAQDICL